MKRTMDGTGQDVPVSQSPSSDETKNKVKINHTEDVDVTILTSCKRNKSQSKSQLLRKSKWTKFLSLS